MCFAHPLAHCIGYSRLIMLEMIRKKGVKVLDFLNMVDHRLKFK